MASGGQRCMDDLRGAIALVDRLVFRLNDSPIRETSRLGPGVNDQAQALRNISTGARYKLEPWVGAPTDG